MPILVVSILVVFGFSFAFHINGFHDDGCSRGSPSAFADTEDAESPGFCTMTASLQTTMSFFYSGPDQTSLWWLDQLFGIVIVIVLLNVVIAIVSDAWSENKRHSNRAYWGYRLAFLKEIEAIHCFRHLANHKRMSRGHRFLDCIDRIDEIREVKGEMHKRLVSCGSLERDYYWAS